MLFVVLGTWPMPFVRPLRAVEDLLSQGLLKDDVVVQSGHTDFQSRHMVIRKFFEMTEFVTLYQKATLILTQAGVGSIMHGLRMCKRVIGVARLRKFGEHVDDHQLEILDLFSNMGHVIAWDGISGLQDVIGRAKMFSPKPYRFDQGRISEIVSTFLAAECGGAKSGAPAMRNGSNVHEKGE